MLIESIDGESRPLSSVKPSSSFACVARGGFLRTSKLLAIGFYPEYVDVASSPQRIHNRERVLTDTRE